MMSNPPPGSRARTCGCPAGSTARRRTRYGDDRWNRGCRIVGSWWRRFTLAGGALVEPQTVVVALWSPPSRRAAAKT